MKATILDLLFAFLSVNLAIVIVVDASSTHNRPPQATTTPPPKSVIVDIDGNATNITTVQSETNSSSVKKRVKSVGETNAEITGKKNRARSNNNGSRTRSSLGETSSSIRRIKKEYKDAVDMGIAYDWVNQRSIQRKNKTKKSKTGDNTIMCLGPITTNLRHWHFSFRGAGEVYSRGIYHGQIVLPKDYPLSPPSIQMWTPSGRFIPKKDICLSASNYHPETWTPRWSIHAVVSALRFHMLSKPNEIGGVDCTYDEIMEHTRRSLKWKSTWVTKKRTTITVDHRLLIKEGILGDATLFEETEEEANTTLFEETEEEANTPTSNDDNAISNIKKDIDEKKVGNWFGLSKETVVNIFQMAIFYMIVFLLLKR